MTLSAPAAAGTGSTTFADSVTCGVTYTYRVRAANDAGSSAYSSSVQATSTVCPPAAPTALAATAGTAAGGVVRVTLQWTDNASNESGFEVERTGGVGGVGPAVTLTPAASSANPTTFVDTTAACGSTYSYKVRATNAGGSSAYSGNASATTVTCTSMYVSDLTATTATQGRNDWRATATVTIKDHAGLAVTGASVSGTWTWVEGTTTRSNTPAPCTTLATGQCSFSASSNIPLTTTTATFTVTGVTLAGRDYVSASNTVTSLAASKPQ